MNARRWVKWCAGRTLLCAAGYLLAVLIPGCGSPETAITVYAPSSLADVLEEAGALYFQATGVRVKNRFESSGMLAREIEHGAPADVFLSADQRWFDQLDQLELLDPQSKRLLAWNSLVVVVPNTAPNTPLSPAAVAKLDRIAIGNPETVPAGAYARQAFETLGLWEKVRGNVVETADVRAALALAERREVDAAVVYRTDANRSAKVRLACGFPEKSHDPIVYPAAALLGSSHQEAARSYLDYLSGPKGRRLFARHGFLGVS